VSQPYIRKDAAVTFRGWPSDSVDWAEAVKLGYLHQPLWSAVSRAVPTESLSDAFPLRDNIVDQRRSAQQDCQDMQEGVSSDFG
jgi:hypothetical protein